MNFRQNIPNFITLGNLLCGVLAIALAATDTKLACYLVLIAAILDLLDGMIARLMKVSSEMGKQLDSLADLVSFGLAPAFLVIVSTGLAHSEPVFVGFLPFMLALASAWRLARFNIDSTQIAHFKGLPTPANAIFWIGIILFIQDSIQRVEKGLWNCGEFIKATDFRTNIDLTQTSVIVGSMLFSLLMISSLKLLNLKFKSFSWNGNEARIVVLLIGLAVILVSWLMMKNIFIAMPGIIILYILISVIYFYIIPKRNHEKIQS